MFEKIIRINNWECPDNFIRVDGICPGCGEKTYFVSIKDCKDILSKDNFGNTLYFGQRICPDHNCNTHIFFIKQHTVTLQTYIDIFPKAFSLKNLNINKLPDEIKECLKEACICYENDCYTSAAILIRKTLEQICSKHGAKGKNLHDRINSLKDKITISSPLYQALFELKYLGNDAAHIESKHFEKIGEEELKLGLTILIEVLRALYEHNDLLESFKELKK